MEKVMIMTHEGEVVAMIRYSKESFRVVECKKRYQQKIDEHLMEGIQYAEGSPLAKFNSQPKEGEDFLKKLAELYEHTRKWQTTFRMLF